MAKKQQNPVLAALQFAGTKRPKLLRRVGRMARRSRKNRHNGEIGWLPSLPMFKKKARSTCHSRVGPQRAGNLGLRAEVDFTLLFSLRENAILKEPGLSYPERWRCVS